MGLLDDLEAEADKRRAAATMKQGEAAENERLWREVTLPNMANLAAYLKQLSDTLGLVEHRAQFSYTLDGYGSVTAAVDPTYRFIDQPRGHQHAIQLEFGAIVVADACPVVAVTGVQRVKTIDTVLKKRGLSGMADARKNDNGEVIEASFRARGKFGMKLEILAEQHDPAVSFQFTNMEAFGNSKRRFKPEQLTPELFDSLGRFIARESDRFASEELPGALRQNLQSKVARDQLQREWEQRLDSQMVDAESRVRHSTAGGSGWRGQLRRLFRR